MPSIGQALYTNSVGMNPTTFNFRKTAFYTLWATITQWRYASIFAFTIFILWVKDGTVDPVIFQPLATVLIGTLACSSLLDVILLLLPAKTKAKLTRTSEEQEAWERLGALEATR